MHFIGRLSVDVVVVLHMKCFFRFPYCIMSHDQKLSAVDQAARWVSANLCVY